MEGYQQSLASLAIKSHMHSGVKALEEGLEHGFEAYHNRIMEKKLASQYIPMASTSLHYNPFPAREQYDAIP
jgi:hypothetical protein